MNSPSSIIDLANIIQANVATVHNARNSSSSGGVSPELAQFAALEAIDELRAQLMGPVQYSIYCSAWWVSSLSISIHHPSRMQTHEVMYI